MPAEINRRIIKPAIKELTEKNYFKSIFFEEIKKILAMLVIKFLLMIAIENNKNFAKFYNLS